ncbi:MAG TPA: hypothetical protein VK915_00205 [Gaiellaceae bacterium]|nr:hypothetical protein [Gaiellaceae bacterium]
MGKGSLLALAVLLAAVLAAPVEARPASSPSVDIQHLAAIAPDGGAAVVQVIASCPERWTVLEASVSVTQPQASGRASFSLVCTGSLQVFSAVTVPASAGVFDLGPVHVSASVVVKRGKTASAHDARTIQPMPIVVVAVADTARLVDGGATMDLTVACSPQTTGVESRLVISRGRVVDVGTYTPFCDGTPHTHTVFVPTALTPGPVQVLTFAQVEFAGQLFYGIDDGTIELVA